MVPKRLLTVLPGEGTNARLHVTGNTGSAARGTVGWDEPERRGGGGGLELNFRNGPV